MNHLKLILKKPLIYIESGIFQTNSPWKHVKRSIDSFEIIYCIKGEIYLQVNEEQYNTSAGDLIIIPPNCLHFGYKESTDEVIFHWVHFYCEEEYSFMDSSEVEVEMNQILSNPYHLKIKEHIIIPTFMTLPNSERVIPLFNHLLHSANSDFYAKYTSNYLLSSILLELYHQFIMLHNNTGSDDELTRRMGVMLEWIRNNINKTISIDDLARVFNYNKAYLARLFKQKMGMSIYEYINNLKISLSKEMLLQSDKSIKEIAYSLGFKDERYFMKLFKKHEQITPTKFRNTYSNIYINNS